MVEEGDWPPADNHAGRRGESGARRLGIGDPRYWAELRRHQLGVVNQALVAVALAAIVLLPQMLGNERIASNAGALRWAVGGLLGLLASLALGIAAAMVRLHDFRLMAKAANKAAEGHHEEAARIKAATKPLGRWTWGLLWAQLIAAAVGFLLLMTSLLLATAAASGITEADNATAVS